jgi:hypothetical protein
VGKIISKIETLLIATEEKPVLRAILMPAIITHLVPLPIPLSFLMFIALPGFIGRAIVHDFFHNPSLPLMIIASVAADAIIYGLCVLICIPLAPFLLKKLLYFVGVTNGLMNIIGLYAKDTLAKMNSRISGNKN